MSTRASSDRRFAHGQRNGPGALPNLVIVGVQKCGTTALHSYVARHPEVFMSTPKELDFFIDDPQRGNWHRGVDWYRARFDPGFAVRGESSPDYSDHPRHDGVPERMAAVVPDARLIFMVRDPVERVRAGYIHHYANRAESRPLREAVLDPESDYLARSRYHHQLSQWLEHYPLERILVVSQEELLRKRRPTLKRVWRFLEVRENVWRESFRIKRLKTSDQRRKTLLGVTASRRLPGPAWRRVRSNPLFSRRFEPPPLDDDLRRELERLLAADTARFRELVGRDFAEWSI